MIASAMTLSIDTRSTHAGGTISLVGDIVIDRPAASTFEAMRATRLALRSMLAKRDRPVAVLVILNDAQLAAPDDAFRREVADTWSEFESQMVAHALVNPAAGFAGAAVRGVMTGINLLSRRKFAQRVFSATDDACAWLQSELVKAGSSDASLDSIRDAVNLTRKSTP